MNPMNRGDNMSIKKLILEPTVLNIWKDRPLSQCIKKASTSAVLVVNDIYQTEAVKDTGGILINDKGPDLLLNIQNLSTKNLQLLVDSYFEVPLPNPCVFTKKTILFFLQLLVLNAKKKKTSIYEELKNWYQLSDTEISKYMDALNIDINSEIKTIFSKNPQYIEAIVSFLWKYHGFESNHEINLSQDKNILVIPVSLLTKSYYLVVLHYFYKKNWNIFFDTDVPFSLVQEFVVQGSSADIYACRYSNDPLIATLASQADEMWSTAQGDPTTFFNWVGKKAPEALKSYSLTNMKRLLSGLNYSSFLSKYFILSDKTIMLARLQENSEWEAKPFDLDFLISQTIDKGNKDIETLSKKIESLSAKVDQLSDICNKANLTDSEGLNKQFDEMLKKQGNNDNFIDFM